jgi:chromosome segregation ATPase
MASSIKQRITKAKEELQDHISSEGIDVTPHKDDIEQMKDILEKDSFETKTEYEGVDGLSEELEDHMSRSDLPNLEPETQNKNNQEGIEDPELGSESKHNKVENNLDKLERQIELLESHEDEEGADINPSEIQDNLDKQDLDDKEAEKPQESGETDEKIDRSHITSKGVSSDLDLEPSKIDRPEKQDFEESKDTENSVGEKPDRSHIEKDQGLKERLDNLESDLRKHEENMVSEESEELSRIGRLENRVENLELENDSDVQDLEQKIGRMENKIERLEHLEGLEDRLNEIEEQLIEDGSVEARIKEFFEREIGQPVSEKQLSEVEERVSELNRLLNKGLEDFDQKTDKLWEMVEEVDSNASSVSEDDLEVLDSKVEELRHMIEEVESNSSSVSPQDLQEMGSKVDKLWEMVEEVDSNSSSVSQEDIEEVDSKVEKLWEAMDEEMASVESRIHDDEQDMEDITSMVVELSELVKQKLRDH